MELLLLPRVVIVALLVAGVSLVFAKRLWKAPLRCVTIGVPVKGWDVGRRNAGIRAKGRIALNSPLGWQQ